MCIRNGKVAVLLFRSDVLTKEEAIGLSAFQGFLLTLNYSWWRCFFLSITFLCCHFLRYSSRKLKQQARKRYLIEAPLKLIINLLLVILRKKAIDHVFYVPHSYTYYHSNNYHHNHHRKLWHHCHHLRGCKRPQKNYYISHSVVHYYYWTKLKVLGAFWTSAWLHGPSFIISSSD